MSLLREWLAEVHDLNRNLAELIEVLRDLRIMIAGIAGWRVLDHE